MNTTGNAAAEFRDKASEGAPDVDLADLGPVNPASAFASGIGTGGTFANGSALDIDAPCCGTGAGVDVVWGPEALGTVLPGFEFGFGYRYGIDNDVFLSDWALVHDKGPGPDGIPGCIGDSSHFDEGINACNQRLGFGAPGPKTAGFFATGQDDRAILRTVGAGQRPAVGARFAWRNASPDVQAYFGTVQNPPTINTAAAFALRDVAVLIPRSLDLLAKLNATACPLTDTGAACRLVDHCIAAGGDFDYDGICDVDDNCPTVANPGQEDGAGGLEVNLFGAFAPDRVGDACDNCLRVQNPRVTPDVADYLAANPWRTLTGGQIDDDHDGYGNRCDAKFVGLPSANVGGLDLAQFRASSSEDRRFDTCGTSNVRPCAIFDLDEAAVGNAIGGLDLGRFRQLNAAPPGPRCAQCTGEDSELLLCEAGTSGSCF